MTRGGALLLACGLAVASTPMTASAQQDAEPDPRLRNRLGVPPEVAEEIRAERAEADLAPIAAGQDGATEGDPAEGDGLIRLSDFSEPVEIGVLVSFFAEELGLTITSQTPLSGVVTFNSSRDISASEALPLLIALLDQYDYALTYNEVTDFYTVRPSTDVGRSFSGPLATTKLIPTPNIRPSALKAAIDPVFGSDMSVGYLDELGGLLVTTSSARIAQLEDLVARVIEEQRTLDFTRIDLEHVAAATALERALGLVGVSSSRPGAVAGRQPNDPNIVAGAGMGGLSNLGDRLRISPNGNSLLFRGRPDELEQVQRIITLIDRPNELEPRRYFAGESAQQIAEIASERGFGSVTTIDQTTANNPNQRQQLELARQQGLSFDSPATGGSVMVVDPARGTIIYYGTSQQQDMMARLIEELDTQRDRVVVREYKLQHGSAEDMADLINALLENRSATADANLLPEGQPAPVQARPAASSVLIAGENQEGEGISVSGGDNVFVIADVANNQILVKAPLKQQDEFAKLIDKLDLRRPQVYLDVQIYTVSDRDTFELAFETQLINAGGTGGLLQTGFGLSPDPTDILLPAAINPGLGGLTAAVINSDFVPIAINAAASETDTRLVSSPKILVDDNEEAEIISVDQQPTSSVSQGGDTTQTSFGGFEDAGTSLRVTPRISEGGYLQLEYEIELSNFVDPAGNAGLPSPRQERSLRADSVTVPGDSTIVVGGITIDETRIAVSKVPLLGDIPLIGELFRSTSETEDDRTLYVFITPRIMRDPTFRDLRLITRGPQAEVQMEDWIPELEPRMIGVVMPGVPETMPPGSEGFAPGETTPRDIDQPIGLEGGPEQIPAEQIDGNAAPTGEDPSPSEVDPVEAEPFEPGRIPRRGYGDENDG
ncbi:MAG: secretin N-terminal domain-containing protein [Planctomycetota bacterium]